MSLTQRFLGVFLISLLGVASVPAFAAAGIIKVAGPLVSVRHADATVTIAKEGTPVEAGDIVLTGTTSDAKLVMEDGQVIYLRPGSAFRIDDYQFKEGEKDGVSFASLLKGGFRTVSGMIGKIHPESYRVNTPTATIGIRGTDYSAVICESDYCDGAQDGLHVYVYNGRIVVSNAAAIQDIQTNEGAIIKKATEAIEPTSSGVFKVTPPPSVFTPKQPGC